MKTPDEIKKGMLLCIYMDGPCSECPYDKESYNIEECTKVMNADAFGYIQQLEALVPRWISVEDRLPEQGAMALCYTRNYIEVLQWDGKSGLWFGLRTINPKGYVTHWMPLPEAPKEE